jgi:hypothetical protein
MENSEAIHFNQASIMRAAETYEWFHRRPHYYVGQSSFSPDEDSAREEAERIEPLLDEVFQDDSGMVYAPSPWHAAFYLECVEDPTVRAKPRIYRGQADCRWEMISSLKRPNVELARVTIAREAFRVFARALSERLGSMVVPLDVADEATAQHYGIPTSLLDFSVDPHVAIYFACQAQPVGNDNPLASVFAYEFDRAAMFGARAYFPHPLADRIYRQYGLFIDMSYCSRDYMREMCHEIRFPPIKSFRPFRRRRPVALLRRSSVFSPLASMAQRWAKKSTVELDLPTARDLVDRRFRNLRDIDEEGVLRGWTAVMDDFLERLCFTPGETAPQFIHVAPIDTFVRDNPLLAQLYYKRARPHLARLRTARNDLIILAFERVLRNRSRE